MVLDRIAHAAERFTDWINHAGGGAVPGAVEFLCYANRSWDLSTLSFSFEGSEEPRGHYFHYGFDPWLVRPPAEV
jgi:hypothetical protein